MVVSTVSFVPPFVLGCAFLLLPSLGVALLAGDAASAVAAALIAIAAFIWPRENFILSNVLCGLRTVPILYVALILVGMRMTHSGPSNWILLALLVALAAGAHWRIRGLIREGTLAI